MNHSHFLAVGYLLTVSVELPGLSRRHPPRRRAFAGVWLTACTYPVVVIVLPPLVGEPFGRAAYLAVAESFAPLAECALFHFTFLADGPPDRRVWRRDMLAIVAANLASFAAGELIGALGSWEWLFG